MSCRAFSHSARSASSGSANRFAVFALSEAVVGTVSHFFRSVSNGDFHSALFPSEGFPVLRKFFSSLIRYIRPIRSHPRDLFPNISKVSESTPQWIRQTTHVRACFPQPGCPRIGDSRHWPDRFLREHQIGRGGGKFRRGQNGSFPFAPNS